MPADSPEADARITLSLNDIPLRAAIDHVAKAANLKLKIEPYAVAVVPQSEPTDVLITKEYKVPPGSSHRCRRPARRLCQVQGARRLPLARNPPFKLAQVPESFWRPKGSPSARGERQLYCQH